MSEKETKDEGAERERTAPGDEAPPDAENAGENVCPDCGGTGSKERRECPTCGGTGRVVEAVGGG